VRINRVNWIKYIALVGFGVIVGWAVPGQPASNARESPRVEPPRIGYVNSVKVMWGFQRAVQAGKKITDSRQEFVAQVKDEQEKLAKVNKGYEAAADPDTKLQLRAKANDIQRSIETIDAKAQKELTEASNALLVETYDQVRTVAAALAKDRGLDVVEGFTGELKADVQKRHELAQLTLQSYGLTPLYLKPELDLTEELIERLNKAYPPRGGEKPAD
jgi:Skp family chaperone for outer membrane proteins